MAARTELDVIVSAQVQHQEQIAKLINDVGKLQKQMRELDAAADKASGGAARLNNKLNQQSIAARNARQGMQQAGMQINDFVTSVSTGASPVQAFNQQIGQLGYAMTMMGGTAAKVGNFLAGPWSILVIGATMVLGPLIEKFLSTKSAADEAAESVFNFGDAVRKMSSAPMEMIGAATAQLNLAQGNLNNARKMARYMGGGSEAYKAGTFLERQRTKAIRDAEAEVEAAKSTVKVLKLINENREKMANNAKLAEKSTGSATAKTNKTLEDQDKIIQKQLNTFDRLKNKLENIITVQTASTTEIGRATQAFSDFKDLIKEISEIKIDGKNIGKEFLEKNAPALAAAEQKMREAMTPESAYEVSEAHAKIISRLEEEKKAYDAVGMAVNDAFKGMIVAGMGWKDAMRGIIQTVIDELWRLFVVQKIVGFISKSVGGLMGGAPGLGKAAPGTLEANFDAAFAGRIGGNATGGYPQAGKPTIVGERGPELFIPSSSGKIVANHNLGTGGGGMVINVDARGSSDPAAVRAQVQQGILEAAPAIIAAAEQRTVSNLRRPRLGGAMQ